MEDGGRPAACASRALFLSFLRFVFFFPPSVRLGTRFYAVMRELQEPHRSCRGLDMRLPSRSPFRNAEPWRQIRPTEDAAAVRIVREGEGGTFSVAPEAGCATFFSFSHENAQKKKTRHAMVFQLRAARSFCRRLHGTQGWRALLQLSRARSREQGVSPSAGGAVL